MLLLSYRLSLLLFIGWHLLFLVLGLVLRFGNWRVDWFDNMILCRALTIWRVWVVRLLLELSHFGWLFLFCFPWFFWCFLDKFMLLLCICFIFLQMIIKILSFYYRFWYIFFSFCFPLLCITLLHLFFCLVWRCNWICNPLSWNFRVILILLCFECFTLFALFLFT